jgi:hypothetical protein
MAARRRSASRQPNRIVTMLRVGTSRCATRAVSRSALSEGRHNRRSLDRGQGIPWNGRASSSRTCRRGSPLTSAQRQERSDERESLFQVGDAAPGNVSTTSRCQQRSDVVDTSGALQSIGVYADVESNKLPNMCRYSVRPALSGRLLWDGLIGARIGPDLRYRRHHFADQPMP